MRSSTRSLALAAGLAFLGACAHRADGPRRVLGPPTGVAVYSRHPRFVEAKISPKGTYLAVVAVEEGIRSLTFVNLATRQSAFKLRMREGAMVGPYHWVNDRRVVVGLVMQDGDLAQPVSLGELFAVDADGAKAGMVFGVRAGMGRGAVAWLKSTDARGSVVGRLRGDDRRVVVHATDLADIGGTREWLYEVDAYDGSKRRIAPAPIDEAHYLTDEDGAPRIAHALDRGMKRRTFFREPDGDWRELTALGPDAEPLGFVGRDRILYVSEPAERGFGLFAVRVDGGGKTLLARNDLSPPSRLVRDRSTGRVVAVEFQPDVPVYEFVEPEHSLSRLLRGLLAAHPDEHVVLEDTTDDLKTAVVKVYGDRSPGRFLLADVEGMTAEPVAEARPWIPSAGLAEATAFHIPASDGLRIHGYLTSPRRSPDAGPPPLVVYPHGGPHFVRNYWGFDPMVQLLASEGFAVLQVNYRGSGGYGAAYQEAGYRHWGDRMIEDVLDATRFAVRKGYADPGRICTFGASFGAYAAVQAAILAPELFRCAIGYAGIYDLTEIEDESPGELRRFWRTVLGDDERALERMSPVHNAARLRARVLLVHGAEDRRAPLAHAKRLRKAMQRTGNRPEWLVELEEGHGFYAEEARERLFARVRDFLRESTAPGAPASPAPPGGTPPSPSGAGGQSPR